MVPLAFILMSRRRKKDYIKVLQAVLDALPNAPSVKGFVVDFEKAMWGALSVMFPEATIRGCVFHLTQAIWRHVQQLGLQKSYEEDDGIHKFIRKVMALPFLPAEHIPQAFRKLQQRAPLGSLTELLDYFEATWLSSSVWPVQSWSAYMQPTRTNNDVEGWHRRLNNKAGEQQKPLYVLLPLLHKEATLVPLQRKLISEKKLKKYQRRATRSIQGQLFDLWERYQEKDISTSGLLRECSRLYGPILEN